MKYYEFEYKNKFQKILWNSNALGSGFIWTMIGFFLTVNFSKFFSTFANTILLIASCFVGLIIFIYNSCKIKGVFLFDKCIEVSSVYTKKTIIPINEITEIREIEKYGIVGRYNIDFKGGGRTDVIQIYFKNIGIVTFKIKNQDEFLAELQKRMSNEINTEQY